MRADTKFHGSWEDNPKNTEMQALDMICIGGDAICSHRRFNNITEHNKQRYKEGWMLYGQNMKEKKNK